MNNFDKVAQKLGFDSQDSSISNKLDLDKKSQKFDRKHGRPYILEIPKFERNGRIWVRDTYLNDPGEYSARQIANNFNFEESPFQDVGGDNRPRQAFHRNNYDTILRIPDAHYFIASEAYDILKYKKDQAPWRITTADKILSTWDSTYGISFKELQNEYTLMNGDVERQLNAQKIKFVKGLGDGREGMGEL